MTDLVFVEEKPMEGREHPLEPGATIGREGCDIVLPDPEVSRRHAAVRSGQGGGLAIEDLGSTNGTFVNNHRIAGVKELENGDVVRFGNTVWRLQATAPPEATKIDSVPGSPQVTAARQVPTDLQPPAPEPQREPEPALQATAARPTPQAPPAPQPGAQPAAPQPAAPSAQPVGPRGDVPPPPIEAPSAIRRVLPPDAASQPPAFSPSPARRVKGSAATRVEATAIAWLIVFAVFVAVTVYFATR